MILYNVTVNVERGIEQDWLQWMKDVHIPNVLSTGHFDSHKILRMLNDQANADGVTYAVQYFAPSQVALDAYLRENAPDLQQEVYQRYGERCLAFRTVLEVVG